MRFLTNKHQSDAEECIAELTRYEDRNLVIGKPRENGAYPVEWMIFNGMVGIYDADKEEEQTEED